MNKISGKNLLVLIEDFRNTDKPILGICVGMQILATFGFENNKSKFSKRNWSKENIREGGGTSYLLKEGKILKNVIIGKNSVIAASCLVNKSCEPNSIMAGIPAKVVKKII